jgi:hypothetical protein
MTDQNIFTIDHLRQIERIKDNVIGAHLRVLLKHDFKIGAFSAISVDVQKVKSICWKDAKWGFRFGKSQYMRNLALILTVAIGLISFTATSQAGLGWTLV